MSWPIGALAGVWRGSGAGEFPTMAPFRYEEEVRFIEAGEPFLIYEQRSWSPDDGEPLHTEAGLWRCTPEGDLAVTVGLSRVAEVSEGRIEDGRITLESTSIRRASGGAALIAARREYVLAGDVIEYRTAIATEDVPALTHHLAGTLRRQADT